MIRKSVALTTLLLLSACMGGTNTPSLTSCMRQIDPNYGKPKPKPKVSVDAPSSAAPVGETQDASAVVATSDAEQQIVQDAAEPAAPIVENSPDAVETASAEEARPAPAAPVHRAQPRRYASAPPPPAYRAPEPAPAPYDDRSARRAEREDRLASREARRAYKERRATQDQYDRRISKAQQRSCMAASVDENSTAEEIRRARLRCRDAG